jgi:hypothetical protein
MESFSSSKYGFGTVKDGLREEVCGMEIAEGWAVARLRSPLRRPPAPRAKGNEQPLVRAAWEKIEANQRRRESAMMDITKNVKDLMKNELW